MCVHWPALTSWVRADYLRDNLTGSKDSLVLRAFSYCIIDEVDSIRIDEALNASTCVYTGPL